MGRQPSRSERTRVKWAAYLSFDDVARYDRREQRENVGHAVG